MIDPVVERQLSDCRELLGQWKEFHEFMTMGVKGENLTPEKEEAFLVIKSKIAMLHDSFMDALTTDQNIGQAVLKIVESAITLHHLHRTSPAEVKKMEIEWHESYLLLNNTIGGLEDKRNELANINEAQYRAGKAAAGAQQKINNFFTSGYFKLGASAAVVLFATVGVQFLGIYDYNELGKMAALREPFRMWKTVYRATVNAESPWPNIEAMGRGNLSGTKIKFQDPEVKSDSKDTFLNDRKRMPDSELASKLKTAPEYQFETLKPDKGASPVEIHTFRYNEATEAKGAYDRWNTFTNEKGNEKYRTNIAAVRDKYTCNIIVFLYSDNAEQVNDIRVNVYKQQ
ncbi:MAG: hypothetical protein K1X53_14030 [Candidatus Sumerlaeaceae bacterium]|nr:hypothetical protein [Candidatus Sumerlaeaceae bacterium]